MDVHREGNSIADAAPVMDNMSNVFLLFGEEERNVFAQKHQRPCTEQNDGLGIKEIYFFMEKNNQWQKFSCPQKAQLLCREKKLGQANGWDNVMADIGNGKRENLVIQKCHLCIFLLHKAKTSLSSATTQVTSR